MTPVPLFAAWTAGTALGTLSADVKLSVPTCPRNDRRYVALLPENSAIVLAIMKEALRDEWLDAYGHLNEGYYLVAFSNACWNYFSNLDLGVDYTARTGCGLYTAESHIRFLREVRAPATLEIQCMILNIDAKRVRYGCIMVVDEIKRATLEGVCIHFDTKAGRAAAMPDNVLARLRAVPATDPPAWVGRGISFEKR